MPNDVNVLEQIADRYAKFAADEARGSSEIYERLPQAVADKARAVLKRYLSLSTTKAKTISKWKAARASDNPGWLAYRERLYEGLRKAGMPEE